MFFLSKSAARKARKVWIIHFGVIIHLQLMFNMWHFSKLLYFVKIKFLLWEGDCHHSPCVRNSNFSLYIECTGLDQIGVPLLAAVLLKYGTQVEALHLALQYWQPNPSLVLHRTADVRREDGGNAKYGQGGSFKDTLNLLPGPFFKMFKSPWCL